MCYALYLASPLTLSEIRSMLPTGFGADLVDPASQRLLKKRHLDAQTGALLLRGRCSCALVEAGAADGVWEAELRKRYRAAKASRDAIIKALERHRTLTELRAANGVEVFTKFVVEHSKNAGATMFYLRFGVDPFVPLSAVPAPTTVEKASKLGKDWLREGEPVVVDA
ncbi:MAG TPA: hypothetical protein VF454_02245 [Gemmatimonadales bacterium]